ncbi:hypothetical protein [Arthrobacter sp. 260]|uniref:hypothetical protein n=1 Tax=Arthrobacter sp. 260 TaxID=2735314 RepID=UPI0014927705|nr:hypothetical protein [Arthrobacter sp. 260]NOJ60508.1 hypothetical protein [Arthrobacter sp. 260]
MNDTTRLTPDQPFPEDLTQLENIEVEVLNSRIHRELDAEYVRYGLPDPETEGRLEELTEELDRREHEDYRANLAPKERAGE